MDRKYVRRLKRELSDELENDLYVSDLSIVDKLIEENYLSSDDWEAIRAIYRPKKQVRQLIHCLGKATDTLEAYKVLCRLLENNHKHLIPGVISILDKYEQIEINCKLRKRLEVPQALRVPDEHDENEDVLCNNETPSTPISCEHSLPTHSVCRDTNTHNCIRGSLMLKTETNDLNKCHFFKNTSFPQYNDSITLNIQNTHFSSQKGCRIELSGNRFRNLRNASHHRDMIRPQPVECENTDVSSETETSENNAVSTESVFTCKLNQRKHTRIGLISKCQDALKTDLPVCFIEENSQPASIGSFISRGNTVVENEEEIRDRASNYLLNPRHVQNDTENRDFNRFDRDMNKARESSTYPCNVHLNLPRPPTCVFRPENVFSDVECNIHMYNSAHHCKECSSRLSRHIFDENRNYVSDQVIQKPPANLNIQNNEYSNVSSESENSESLGQTYNCECNRHITTKAFKECLSVKSMDQFPESSAHCLVLGRKIQHIHGNPYTSGSRSRSIVNRYLTDMEKKCQIHCHLAVHSESSSESASSSLEIKTNSSASEMNTDVSRSDLNSLEIKFFDKIAMMDGNISDFMDDLIGQGCITEDDIYSINKQLNDEKKVAMLAKVLCRPKKLKENDDLKFVLRHESSDIDTDEAENSSEAKTALYKYPMTILKDFGKTFDSLNDKVNNGYLEISLFPTDPDEACITYHLQACDKLYHNDTDAAELLIAKASQAANESKHQMQLRGEVFTAKTWLCLITGRTGKMLDLLQQHEQLLDFMPGMWSSTARGWFYHDYARCYLKLLNLGSRKHIKAKKYYKQQALKSARKAIEHFKESDNSDGPLGIGYSASLVIDALLEATDILDVSALDISTDDIKEAEKVCQFIERQFDPDIPPVLKCSYLLNRSCLSYRKHEIQDALALARKSLKLAREINVHNIIRLAEKLIDMIQRK